MSHDKLRQAAEAVARNAGSTAEYMLGEAVLTLLDEIVELRAALEKLSVIGNEKWETPGHPMNEYVSRETVQLIAKKALGDAP